MIKQNDLHTTNSKQALKDDKSEWHFEYAAKMLDSWPSWKKEVYNTNFSNAQQKKLVSSCK